MKTKHEKIVEKLKTHITVKDNCSLCLTFEQVEAILEQLEPEGEEEKKLKKLLNSDFKEPDYPASDYDKREYPATPQQPSEKETMFIETKENDATHVVLEYGTNKSCGAKKLTPQQPSDSAGEEVSDKKYCPVSNRLFCVHWHEYKRGCYDCVLQPITRPTVSEDEIFTPTIIRDEAVYFCEPYDKVKHGEPLKGKEMLLRNY